MTYIYESPDGGQTVYRREPLSTTRELHYKSDLVKGAEELLEQIELWKKIQKAAEHNQTLQKAIDRVRVIYELSRDHS